MKHWLFAAALICFGSGAARAQNFNIRLSSAPNGGGIAVSSQTPTAIVSGAGSDNWIGACVQNISTSGYVACASNVNVSTNIYTSPASTAVNPLAGTFVPAALSTSTPNAPTCFLISVGSPFYCLCSWGMGACPVVVTKEH